MIDRRTFLAAGACAALAAGCRAATSEVNPTGAQATVDARKRFEAIRATLGPGGRLGVAAIETGSGRELRFDADSRYSMASTIHPRSTGIGTRGASRSFASARPSWS